MVKRRRPSLEFWLSVTLRVFRLLYPLRRAVKVTVEFNEGDPFSTALPPFFRKSRSSGNDSEDNKPSCAHSPDFASVNWNGTVYKFTKIQRIVVRELWQAKENGTPELSQEYLLETAESNSAKLSDLFQHNAAWGTVIVPGESRGSYQLGE